MVMSESTLKDRIEERMHVLGLNPYSAAKRAGLGQSFVRDIISGKAKNPRSTHLSKLATALECSINYLLGEQELELVPTDRPDVFRIEVPPHGTVGAPAMTMQGDDIRPAAHLLPVRFEVQAGGYRKASDVARHRGYEATTVPAEYAGRQCWWELVRDNSVEAVAPAGSLVLVVDLTDEEKGSLEDGDFVISLSRHAGPNFNLVQRTMRRITFRYPDIGLWFYEFAYFDGEMNLTDDVYRHDDLPEATTLDRPLFQDRSIAPSDRADLSPEMEAKVAAVDAVLLDQRKLTAFLEYQRTLRVTIQGKVIKVVRALGPHQH